MKKKKQQPNRAVEAKTPPVAAFDQTMMTEMLQSATRRPKVLMRDTQTIEREVESEKDEVHELPNGDKVVIDVHIVRLIQRIVVVREFDPDASYSDAIKEFMDD